MPPTDAKAPPPVTVTKPNPHNNPAMFKIFQNVQYNVVQHKKYVKEMKKLYKNVSIIIIYISWNFKFDLSEVKPPNPNTVKHWLTEHG